MGIFDRQNDKREDEEHREDKCCDIDPIGNLCPAFKSCEGSAIQRLVHPALVLPSAYVH